VVLDGYLVKWTLFCFPCVQDPFGSYVAEAADFRSGAGRDVAAVEVGRAGAVSGDGGADGVHGAGESAEPGQLGGGVAPGHAAPAVARAAGAQAAPARAHSGDVPESLAQHARHQHRVE
jgi:hypothetical protein